MDPVNKFYHTFRVAVVTITDRPTSVCNRCVIEGFGGLFCRFAFWYQLYYLILFVDVRTFVIGLGKISSFYSNNAIFIFVPKTFLRTFSHGLLNI